MLDGFLSYKTNGRVSLWTQKLHGHFCTGYITGEEAVAFRKAAQYSDGCEGMAEAASHK